ncbi:carnosine N-methyltransferase-like [Ptychodera flava]|uniref:carnosine N-methyltransferase-like n=1 Tax=Ptychodera flava TaxID=63121 RepID=UPI003969E725
MAHSGSEIQPENDEERLEREHFHKVLRAFSHYKKHAIERVSKSQTDFHALPERHRKMLPDFLPQLGKIRTCIDHNYEVLKLIIEQADDIFENKAHGPATDSDLHMPVSTFDLDKVKTTLRQFVRDWSEDGRYERDQSYTPIIEEIQKLFPGDQCNVREVSVLVPGAGLGRLAFEIARRGYMCQGNEISLYMLFGSNFILNRSYGVNYLTIYPWVHNFCNNKSKEDQIRPVHIPDTDPSTLPTSALFSMAAGDFLEVYKDPDSWDCVATSYFIDTGHNILAYIETIYNILKPGGYWVNLGPLLYHFSDIAHESSIELSYDVVKRIIKDFGFEIVKENQAMPSTYTHNQKNMLKYEYSCIFIVCRKPERPHSNGTLDYESS